MPQVCLSPTGSLPATGSSGVSSDDGIVPHTSQKDKSFWGKLAQMIRAAHALASAPTQSAECSGGRPLGFGGCPENMTDGTLGRPLDRIFPDAWTDGLDDVSARFDAPALTLVACDEAGGRRGRQPDVDGPHAEESHADHPRCCRNRRSKGPGQSRGAARRSSRC